MNISEALQKVNELYQANQFAQAAALCQQILQRDAANHMAWYLLGAALLRVGENAKAEEALGRAVQLASAVPVYQSAYGTALVARHKYAQAAQAFRKAIVDSPQLASAHRGLGRALMQLGEPELAENSLEKSLEYGSSRAETLADIAIVKRRQGKLPAALVLARESVALAPEYAWGRNVLGLIQSDSGDQEAAIAEFEKALALRPNLSEAFSNLARSYYATGQYAKAIAVLRSGIEKAPNDPAAWANLGKVLMDVGPIDKAIPVLRRAHELDPGATMAHSNLLHSLNYMPQVSAQTVADEHRRWGTLHGQNVRPDPPPRRQIAPGTPLRVGYLTPDLWKHPVTFFFEPLLRNHDPKAVLAFVYSDTQRPDEITEKFRHIAPRWRDSAGRSNSAVERMIRSDEIDILVDLAGHTENNRLQLFLSKPAPLQVSYLGYPNTTGLLTMDYRLTDSWADAPGSEAFYTEKLVRLPRCFLCYTPPEHAAAPVRTGDAETITFGCLNRVAKITDEAIGLWAKILQATPGSRLLFKDKPLVDRKVCEVFLGRLAAQGIPGERVKLEWPKMQHAEHLSLYNSIDVALDTFPYNGTTTTCEALWMGVPVVTLVGQTHASRVSFSLLNCIGHAELAAQSPEEYVRLAVELAADRAVREKLRQTLRGDVMGSALIDGVGLAKSIEGAYQRMWAGQLVGS
jgi:predicted O-linked N-acetylglucosamine transferase (SPINDLY family)